MTRLVLLTLLNKVEEKFVHYQMLPGLTMALMGVSELYLEIFLWNYGSAEFNSNT